MREQRNGRVHSGDPFSSLASAGLRSLAEVFGSFTSSPYYYMKDMTRERTGGEPIGIVISRGSEPEQLPVICAFVWGAAPETAPARKDTKAA